MNFFRKLFGKKIEGKDEGESLCEQCGHSSGAHELKGYGEMPLEGWMECPVDGCECYSTWSVDEEARPAMEQYKKENGIE